MNDPFEAVNAYVKWAMEEAITVPKDVNKHSAGWVTAIPLFKLKVKTKKLHDCREAAEYHLRDAVCDRLFAGKGLPDLNL